MQKILNLLGLLFGRGSGANPHYTVIDERVRVTSPDARRDAVLIQESGRHQSLYVVRRGKPVHGRSRLAVFIHCGEIDQAAVSWQNTGRLRVNCECEQISLEDSSRLLDDAQGSYLLRV